MLGPSGWPRAWLPEMSVPVTGCKTERDTMYTILYLRDLGNGQKQHRTITCDCITDMNRIRIMLRGDKGAYDLSCWQGDKQII